MSSLLQFTTGMTLSPKLFPALALLIAAVAGARAETLPADHPSATTVKKYLEAVVKEDWKTASDMLLPSSLERLKQGTIAAIKNSRTMTEEATKLNLLGIKDVRELEKMSPQDAYIVDRKSVHEHNRINPDDLKRKQESLKINILGLVPEEAGKIVHAIVRTKQETTEVAIEELLVISVTQDKDDAKKWLVVPDMQLPITTPLKKDEPAKEEKK